MLSVKIAHDCHVLPHLEGEFVRQPILPQYWQANLFPSSSVTLCATLFAIDLLPSRNFGISLSRFVQVGWGYFEDGFFVLWICTSLRYTVILTGHNNFNSQNLVKLVGRLPASLEQIQYLSDQRAVHFQKHLRWLPHTP